MSLMIRTYILLFFIVVLAAGCQKQAETTATEIVPGPITLVIHGGAGTILKENMTPEREAAYHAKLTEALNAGYAVLEGGGTSVDAVMKAINVMEDSPLFNAGKGAVFTNEGRNEMDAAIMDGKTLEAGAVAGVTTVKNPILAANAVRTQSEHVMMAGEGADLFAKEHGVEVVDPEYFFDSARYQQLIRAKQKETSYLFDPYSGDNKYGTVGAVALDSHGNLAAGTSTGGMTNKRYGRIGDAPIIGAGTYANNGSCAISATGHGEYFIRAVVAHEISSLMSLGNLSLNDAADSVVMRRLVRMGGSGGVIGLDRAGNYIMTFNSKGMYRGVITEKGKAQTFIYGD